MVKMPISNFFNVILLFWFSHFTKLRYIFKFYMINTTKNEIFKIFKKNYRFDRFSRVPLFGKLPIITQNFSVFRKWSKRILKIQKNRAHHQNRLIEFYKKNFRHFDPIFTFFRFRRFFVIFCENFHKKMHLPLNYGKT